MVVTNWSYIRTHRCVCVYVNDGKTHADTHTEIERKRERERERDRKWDRERERDIIYIRQIERQYMN